MLASAQRALVAHCQHGSAALQHDSEEKKEEERRGKKKKKGWGLYLSIINLSIIVSVTCDALSIPAEPRRPRAHHIVQCCRLLLAVYSELNQRLPRFRPESLGWEETR